MAEMEDGGPAYPQDHWVVLEGGVKSLVLKGGMTIRDEFAKAAITGLASRAHPTEAGELGVAAFAIADLMLAARSHPPSSKQSAGSENE